MLIGYFVSKLELRARREASAVGCVRVIPAEQKASFLKCQSDKIQDLFCGGGNGVVICRNRI